jgi:hypothetical protein
MRAKGGEERTRCADEKEREEKAWMVWERGRCVT